MSTNRPSLNKSDFRPASERPKRSMETICRCGVTGDIFDAYYEKKMDCWLWRGQRVIFGNREVEDEWKPKPKRART